MSAEDIRTPGPLKHSNRVGDAVENIPVAELVGCLEAYQKIQGELSEETAGNAELVGALRQAERTVKTREADFDRALKTEVGLKTLLPHIGLSALNLGGKFELEHPEIPLQALRPWATSLLERQLPHYSAELDASLTVAGDDLASQKKSAISHLASVTAALLFPSQKAAEEGNDRFLKSSLQALEKMYRIAKQPPIVDFGKEVAPTPWEAVKFQKFLYEYGVQDISDVIKGQLVDDFEKFIGAFSHITLDAPKYGADQKPEGTMLSLRDKRVQNLFEGAMKKLNLPRDGVLSEWQKNEVVENNLIPALQLESRRPGAPRLLAEQFGIYEFGRYPVEVLRNQIEEMESDKPYGLAIYPRVDEGGDGPVFQGSDFRLEVFMGKLHELGHTFRIIEVGSKIELARRIIELDDTYAQVAGKIGFAIIHGHGTPDSIQLGAGNGFTKGKEYIISKDVWNGGAQRLSSYFRARVPILLDSCSTGENSGIGQQLSAIFRTKVIAPKIPTKLIRAIPKLTSGGNIDLDAQYRSEESAKTYVRGRLKERRKKHK